MNGGFMSKSKKQAHNDNNRNKHNNRNHHSNRIVRDPKHSIDTHSATLVQNADIKPHTPEHYLLMIRDFNELGEGVGRAENGKILFVRGAVPGDEVKCVTTKARKNYAHAVVTEIVKPSEDRIVPPCPYFGECGGCALQHVSYEAQLRYKKNLVFSALTRISGIAAEELECVFRGVRPSNPYRYRNKGRFFYTGEPDLPFGMMARSSNRMIPVRDCLLMPESFAAELAAYARGGDKESEIQNFKFGDELLLRTYDKSYSIAGIDVEVQGDAFFQVNTAVAETLFREVLDLVPLTSSDLVAELYSGVGVLTMLFSEITGNAVGVEINEHAVRSAIRNAEANDLPGARFHCADVLDFLHSGGFVEHFGSEPRLVVLDPPRAGCDARVLEQLSCDSIIYISCEPATLARDLKLLMDRGYCIEYLSIHDMFAQTTRVECIALIQKGKS